MGIKVIRVGANSVMAPFGVLRLVYLYLLIKRQNFRLFFGFIFLSGLPLTNSVNICIGCLFACLKLACLFIYNNICQIFKITWIGIGILIQT